MAHLGTAAAQLVELIEAAGVKATTDTRGLNLPGAWVTATGLDYERMAGTVGRFSVFLVARDNGPRAALDALSTMSEQLRMLPELAPAITEATVIAISLPNHGADGLPALQIDLELDITED